MELIKCRHSCSWKYYKLSFCYPLKSAGPQSQSGDRILYTGEERRREESYWKEQKQEY